jgi:hypothetical protein
MNGAADHGDAPVGRKREILNEFAGWHTPVLDLIAATPDEEILKHPAMTLLP